MRGSAVARTTVALLVVISLGVPGSPSATTLAATEQNYLQYCSGCHQADGTGSARNRVPTLPGSLGHFVRTARGRAFLIQIAGVAQAPLADDAIAALLNWLLPRFSAAEIPPTFKPYTASEVQEARGARPADTMALRGEIERELERLGYKVATY